MTPRMFLNKKASMRGREDVEPEVDAPSTRIGAIK